MRRFAAVLALLAAGAATAAGEPARRIVTLAPNLAELVWTAGAGDALVGTVEWSDWPEAVRALPRVGNAFRVDLEALASLEPDLVLAWGGGNPDHLIRRLEADGYRVEVLAPRRLEDIGRHIAVIGRLAGTEPAARRAAGRYRATLDALAAAQAGKPPLRVFFQASWRPLYTVGSGQLIGEVIALCGGVNVFADLCELAPSVSVEAVLASDPQAILTASEERGGLDSWQRWPELAAVRYHNLFAIPGDFIARPAPRILEGARRVCAALDDARSRLPLNPG